jgi:hypothetical protein
MYTILYLEKILYIKNGEEIYFSSQCQWMRKFKRGKIILVLFKDFMNNLYSIYLNSDRFTICFLQSNMNRVHFMKESDKIIDYFFVSNNDMKNSFYSIMMIIDQIENSFSPRITPIFDRSAVLVSPRYVVSDSKIDSNTVEILIFDIEISDLFASFQMNGRKMMGCQYTDNANFFFIYTDIECLYISANRELLLRARIEIIGNFIFSQKKVEAGFEVYVFDFRKNEIIYDFRIAGNWIQYNHVLTFDDSIVLRAWTECDDKAFVVV